MNIPNSNLGDPDIQFGPFQIWIHDRELLRPTYYDEENWLRITARFITDNSEVWVMDKPALLADQLETFYRDARFNKRIKLETIEPYIELSFEPGDKNKIDMKVEMIPTPGIEKHAFLTSLSKAEYESGMKQIADIVKKTHSKDSPI